MLPTHKIYNPATNCFSNWSRGVNGIGSSWDDRLRRPRAAFGKESKHWASTHTLAQGWHGVWLGFRGLGCKFTRRSVVLASSIWLLFVFCDQSSGLGIRIFGLLHQGFLVHSPLAHLEPFIYHATPRLACQAQHAEAASTTYIFVSPRNSI